VPKVSDTYKIKKNEEILDAASRVLRQRTLYEINMTNVIKEAGISKGGIYLYYKDIDELIVAVMDRELKADNFRERIDTLLHEDCPMETIISKLLQLYAMYLQESSVLAGKMLFELTILLTQNRERALKIRGKVSLGETGAYFTQKISDIIINNLGDNPKFQKKSKYIINYVQCFIEGVLQIYVLEICYQFDVIHINLDNMMEMLAKNIVNMIKDESADR